MKPGKVPPRTILAELVREIAKPGATDEIKGTL
jgi:hypothetical protein